jgi:exodeoxyribonuclease VII small subunit
VNDGDFEKQLKRLQKIVAMLESGDVPLEKGVALYKEGLELAAGCRKRLEEARVEIGGLGQAGLEEQRHGDD